MKILPNTLAVAPHVTEFQERHKRFPRHAGRGASQIAHRAKMQDLEEIRGHIEATKPEGIKRWENIGYTQGRYYEKQLA